MTDVWLCLLFFAVLMKGHDYHSDFTEIKDSIYSLRNSVDKLRHTIEQKRGEQERK